MTPQERQLIDDLFDRLSRLESAPRDPEAAAAIAQGLRKAPNAVYPLVQTVLVQDEALKRANSRIQELEAAGAPEENRSGGFLDSMRETIFGQSQPRGSVPNVPPPEAPSRHGHPGRAARCGTAVRSCSRASLRDSMVRHRTVRAMVPRSHLCPAEARFWEPRPQRPRAWSAAHCCLAASVR